MSKGAALSVCIAAIFCAAVAPANDPVHMGNSVTNVQVADEPCKGRDFEDFDLIVPLESGSGQGSVVCVTNASGGPRNGKGIKVTFDAELLDEDLESILPLPRRTGKINKGGYANIDFDLPTVAGAAYVRVEGNPTTGKKATGLKTTCWPGPAKNCVPNATTLCLDDDRFRVEVDWRSGARSGAGQVITSTNRTGFFNFEGPLSDDVFVEILNNCRNNGHFWVFAAATTAIEFDLTVTDTFTGETRVYDNPLGQAAQPILDTSAFATCP